MNTVENEDLTAIVAQNIKSKKAIGCVNYDCEYLWIDYDKKARVVDSVCTIGGCFGREVLK